MKKRLCIFWDKEIKHSWVFKVFVYGLVVGSLFVGKALSTVSVLALSYSQAVDVSFELKPTLSVSLSSADLLISELAPGNVADSNTITVGVSTNASFGYTLSANVGNDTKYDTRSLIRADDDTSEFASIATDATMSTITTDNAWGFSSKLTTDGASWAYYSGLPLYSDTQNTKIILETSSPQDANTVDFKIAAKAGNTIAAGEYKNVINFIAVAKPEPTPAPIECVEDAICYSVNALDNTEGTMGRQANVTAGSTVMLVASNFSRSGFGFAGWNTAPDYSGTTYGPNEDVTMPADMSNGLSLYAVWVPSKGAMQGWEGCVGLNIGDVTALTDIRDNDTYAVAKLADGKCWMIENLRLADTHTEGNTAVPTTLTTTNTNNPLNDNNSTNPTVTLKHNYSDTNTYPTLSSTSSDATSWCQTNSAACDNQSRLRTDSTASRVSYQATDIMSTDANLYSYGNYYNWYSATAGNGTYSFSTNNNSVGGDLCPAGWRLPIGGRKANVSTSDFWSLSRAVIGADPANFANDYFYYTGNYTGNPEGTNASKLLRTYPNNLLYSGYVTGASIIGRGSSGYYWSSTVNSSNSAYLLGLSSSNVGPGTYGDGKYNGRAVRCLAAQ